jgi:hypothetical protein
MRYDDCKVAKRCEICGQRADPHEIISRKTGGPREAWNVIYLCFIHHREYHDLGRSSWARKYPQFLDKITAACEQAGRIMK